jgi:hypothetical protein
MDYFEFPALLEGIRDGDYAIKLWEYNTNFLDIYEQRGDIIPSYLYHWYIFFYPFSLLPMSIGVYVWDILRVIICYYVGKNITKISNNKELVRNFYLLTIIGYFFDTYNNNNNFLILLLLFLSFINLKKNRRWLAGIFFALASYKITVILFLLLFLLIKEIKFTDLIYFIIPLLILCLPYVIFPELLFQFIDNILGPKQSQLVSKIGDPFIDLFITIGLILWPLLQPAHLMYYSLLIMIVQVHYYKKNLEKE